MKARFSYPRIAPGVYDAMDALDTYLGTSGLERPLLLLVQLRSSQLNGCAFCIDMHWKDLRAIDETEQRLYGLDAWRESPYYTDRERAALEWTDAVTRVAETHADDAAYDAVRPHFTDKELVDLTWVIAAINAWNRIAISFRPVPGKYRPPQLTPPPKA